MRRIHISKLALLAAALLVLFAGNAMAGVVFDLSPTNNVTFRSPGAGSGVGQGVLVGATGITITDMAFYLNMPSGGDLKFMIWDSTDANLLFSSVLSGVGLSEIPSWVSSSPFSFTLQANTEYWFGIIADNNVDVGYISTPIGYSANGLTADTGGNSNYSTFANPTFYNKGGAEIGLQLSGGGVPEPGSIFLLGSGVLALAGILRRKMN
jgi:hypothetical protein